MKITIKNKDLVIQIFTYILSLATFVIMYKFDVLGYRDNAALSAMPAFFLSVLVLLISQTIWTTSAIDRVCSDSQNICETVKDYLHITKMGTPKAAWNYVINNLPNLERVQNTSFNFGDENLQTEERLYEGKEYNKSLLLISNYVNKGLKWQDIGDESALERFKKINTHVKNKNFYQYKIISQSEPQIGFIILTYKDGKTEVLFNWDFRDIPKDPVVLLSRNDEVLNMFSAQYIGLWRVGVEPYDNIATKSTS